MPKAIRRSRRKKSSRKSGLVSEWFVVVLAVVGAIGVGLGVFDWKSGLPWYGLVLGAAILLAGLRDALRRFKELPRTTRGAASIEGPLLWTVLIWMLFRLSGPLATHTIILPIAFLAWITVISELKVVIAVSLSAFIMEMSLTLLALQPFQTFGLNVLTFGLAIGGLRLFTHSEVFRQELKAKQARQQAKIEKEEYARDLGFYNGQKKIRDSLPSFEDLYSRKDVKQDVMKFLPESFTHQLDLLRRSLGLTTVALLWADSENRELRLRNIATSRKDILSGPYQIGYGITGAFLRDVNEVGVAPVKEGFGGVPYYREKNGVGSIFAIKVPPDVQKTDEEVQGRKINGLLVADRQSDEPWNESERDMFSVAARKLALDVELGRQYQIMAREHGSFLRVCVALRELNRALGLDSVLEATHKAVKAFIAIDFLAISLLQGETHTIVKAAGNKAEYLVGREFQKDEGLVGQVLKLGCQLPAGAKYRGSAPVFSDDERLSGYNSLLIIPLRKEDSSTIGALTLAANKSGVLTEARQDILSLVADQVAVKIDLGKSHEQISKLATTDGLTGLANHRSFQHGFDMMLDRAERQNHSLCLILCDIDHFKRINDTYGHPFGDQVLKGVASVLRGAVRKIDLAARYGGEEFAVVLEKSDEKGGKHMAERIRRDVGALIFKHTSENVSVTMSFGIAAFPADGKEKQLLINRADKSLYEAKKTGRNKSIAWSELITNK